MLRNACDHLRTGDWLTRERVRLIAFAVLIASAAGIVFLLATASGLTDARGRPLGTDFSNVYAAGTYVREGRPEAPFDPALQHAREKQIFGEATPFYGWHYPPFFLLIAAALATLPYLMALAVWQLATLALYLLAIRAILRSTAPPSPLRTGPADPLWADPLWIVAALAYPAVFVNLGHGHNGFLTAALLGLGLAVLDRRPIAAGVLFGLLAYKPQFGLLIPLVLIAGGRWRSFASASVTLAALVVLVTILYGMPVWHAFLDSAAFTRTVVLESGGAGWHKIQSVFAWLRMWGGSVALAYAGQTAVTLSLAVVLAALWRSAAAFPLKAAALAIGCLLATPYSLDYDVMALAPALAFLAAHGVRHGFDPFEKTLLALCWLMPLFARSAAQVTFMPVGVWLMLALLLMTLRRAAKELDLAPRQWLVPPRA